MPSGHASTDTAAGSQTMDVISEHRLMVTKGTTITWFDICTTPGGQTLAVCGACNEFGAAAGLPSAREWANRHAGQGCTTGPRNHPAPTPTPAGTRP